MAKGYRYTGHITFNEDGWLASGQFPAECIEDCSASGAVDNAVTHWRMVLGFTGAVEPHRERVERYLREYGAWDDLSTADIETLAERVLWLACCDIRESGEWLGLVH